MQNIMELYVQLALTDTILDPATHVSLLILFAMLIVKMEPVLHAILVIQSTDKDALLPDSKIPSARVSVPEESAQDAITDIFTIKK